MTCSHDCDPCIPQQPTNVIDQAVTDAMAKYVGEFDGYVAEAEQSAASAAEDSAVAQAAKQAAQAAQGNAETAANTAIDAQTLIAESVTILQQTADDIRELDENLKGDVANLTYIRKQLVAAGGETTITLAGDYDVIAAVFINGNRQEPGYNYTYDLGTKLINLAAPLEAGDLVSYDLASLATVPDFTNYAASVQWVYNEGSATGGETSVVLPYQILGMPMVFINSGIQVPGLHFEALLGSDTVTINLAQPLEVGDVLFIILMLPTDSTPA